MSANLGPALAGRGQAMSAAGPFAAVSPRWLRARGHVSRAGREGRVMGFRKISYLIPSCDGCGLAWSFGDPACAEGIPPHFASRAAALASWPLTTAGRSGHAGRAAR